MPPVKLVILVGPDGSGKTTIADCLSKDLEQRGLKVVRANFSFGILPSLSTLANRTKRKVPPEGQKNSGMVKPIETVHAMLLAIWYGIDHLLGLWKVYRSKEVDVFILARSYHDFFYQRAYLKLPRFIPRLFVALGPKPDLVAMLQRDPAIINSEKPELTVREIEEQYSRIRRNLQRYKYFSEIDATIGIDNTTEVIRKLAQL